MLSPMAWPNHAPPLSCSLHSSPVLLHRPPATLEIHAHTLSHTHTHRHIYVQTHTQNCQPLPLINSLGATGRKSKDKNAMTLPCVYARVCVCPNMRRLGEQLVLECVCVSLRGRMTAESRAPREARGREESRC